VIATSQQTKRLLTNQKYSQKKQYVMMVTILRLFEWMDGSSSVKKLFEDIFQFG